MGVVKRFSGGKWVDVTQILRKAGSQAPVSTFTVRSGGKWGSPAPPVTPPVAPPAGGATPYLPFDMSTAPSTKIVLGHITPWFPVSIDNQDPASDYYTTQWLTPGGEGGNYAAYGGRLRDRPWRRPPISGDWKLEDCRAEIAQAKSVGIDAFTIDLVSMAHKATVDKYFQAAALDSFKCLPQSDMSPGTPYASMSEANYVAEIQPYLTHAASFKLPDGRPVLNCFLGETRTTAWWANVKSVLASNGVNVALILTQLSPGTVAAYAPLCYAISIWGSGTPAGTAPASTVSAAAAARNAGAKWMAPIRFQDVRPALACYWESANGLAYRQSWEGAIQQADLAQLITWNDYNEGTQIARSDKHGWRHLDRMAYDIARFKYGSYPAVVRDCVYFTHRSQRVNSKPTYAQTKLMQPGVAEPSRDNVEVEVFATAPATLQTTVGGARRRERAGGVQHLDLSDRRRDSVHCAGPRRHDSAFGDIAVPGDRHAVCARFAVSDGRRAALIMLGESLT